ncbi:MAG: trypsin-like peptidase domain-containing protein [Minisyncoccia bacterium]|jgi:S1-C subfamily serine protease
MKTFWQNYKFAIVTFLILSAGYGGYRGVAAFQSYEQNQINAAVQAKANQIEQSLIVPSSTPVVATTTSVSVDARVGELETEIAQLKAAQVASPKKSATVASTAQIATLQKQVTALKNATSNAPVITFVNPTIMIANYENTVSINGSGFEANARVKLGDTNLQTTGSITQTLISAHYPSGFNPGLYDVTVTNPDGGQFVFPGAVTIRPGSPITETSNTLTTSQIVAKVSPSVVLIRTNLGCGSGMVVQQSGGYILTNNHVISGANTITVYTPDGSPWNATVIGTDPSEDLALISINNSNLPPVTFGDSSDASLPLGSDVVALGYPTTCNTDQTIDIEPGMVTARRIVAGAAYLGALIQDSARINPGDSGGPLVNNQGQVIGIDNAIATIAGIELNLLGIAYAIPAQTVQPDLGTIGLPNAGASQSSPTQNSPQPPTAGVTPYAVVSAASGTNQFVVNGSGFCGGSGGASIILSGYPLQADYSVPSSFVSTWTDSQITFSVPGSIDAKGNFSVIVRGYGSAGYCTDIRASGTAAVQ